MLIGEIAASLIFRAVERAYEWVALHGVPLPSGLYVHRVARDLREMPFIYKDLPLDVRADFVEIELESVTYGAAITSGKSRLQAPDPFRFLVDYRHVVVIGEAGMGKTTLFRLAVQSLDRQYRDDSPLQIEKNLIPIFVPLKAINNSSPSPITTFILENVSYFRGPSGRRRLQRLAHKRRILLLLDAYDEIPYVDNARSIQLEIETLFNSHASTVLQRAFHDDDQDIYDALRRCRIWISTRAEFLDMYPLRLDDQVKCLLTKGLSSQRIRLVRKIFDRYRLRGGQFLAERLDEEDFMQQLLKYSDSVVSELSHSPLFLTVLCYTYVNYIREANDPKMMWQQGQYELIETCLRLLIADIDEQKTRGLSEIKRRALMNRRSTYIEEKLLFLKFLAAETYLCNVPVIKDAWMIAQAKTFFEQRSTSTNSAEIRRGLDSDDPSANLVSQLILSGVFTKSGSTADGPVYDFPHRRFREKLATDFFQLEEGRKELFTRVGDPQFSELLLVFVDRFAIDQTLTDAIVNRICGSGDTGDLARLLGRCLVKAGSKTAANAVVARLIAILSNVVIRPTSLSLPSELFVDHLEVSERNLDEMRSTVARALSSGDAWLFALAFPVLIHLSPDSAERALCESAQGVEPGSDLFLSVLKAAMLRPSFHSLEIALRRIWPSRPVNDLQPKEMATVFKIFIEDQSLSTRRQVIEYIEKYLEQGGIVTQQAFHFLNIARSYVPKGGETAILELAPEDWLNAKIAGPNVWT